MGKAVETLSNREDWNTIRDFTRDETGFTFPKYEAKLVTDVDKEFIEDEIVMVRETDSISGRERIHHIPAEVFEGMAEVFLRNSTR